MPNDLKLKPCPFCGEQCAGMNIDQGDKWAHYEPSCLETRTGYDLSPEAPWRSEAVRLWNTRHTPDREAVAKLLWGLDEDLSPEDAKWNWDNECGLGENPTTEKEIYRRKASMVLALMEGKQ